jgi:hypothetical protein
MAFEITRLHLHGDVLESFEDFINENNPQDLPLEWHQTLADYIRSWVLSGRGVRVCQGDYQTFTLAIIAIIEQWLTMPDMLDLLYNEEDDPADADYRHEERRVTKIFGEGYLGREILDPHFFAKATYCEQHGDFR